MKAKSIKVDKQSIKFDQEFTPVIMTVETIKPIKPEDVIYQKLESKGNHPSSLLSSATENNELRNVSFKAVIASKYTLLNGTLLELLGAVDINLNGQKSIADEEKTVSDYELWLSKVKEECEELQKQDVDLKDDPLTSKLAELNTQIANYITNKSTGLKITPRQDPHYLVFENKFKSQNHQYERASTVERQEVVANLEDVVMTVSETVESTTDFKLDDAPIIGAISGAPELAHFNADQTALAQEAPSQEQDYNLGQSAPQF